MEKLLFSAVAIPFDPSIHPPLPKVSGVPPACPSSIDTGISKELAKPNDPEPLSAEPAHHWRAAEKEERGMMLIKSLNSKALYIHHAKEFLELSMLEV